MCELSVLIACIFEDTAVRFNKNDRQVPNRLSENRQSHKLSFIEQCGKFLIGTVDAIV